MPRRSIWSHLVLTAQLSCPRQFMFMFMCLCLVFGSVRRHTHRNGRRAPTWWQIQVSGQRLFASGGVDWRVMAEQLAGQTLPVLNVLKDVKSQNEPRKIHSGNVLSWDDDHILDVVGTRQIICPLHPRQRLAASGEWQAAGVTAAKVGCVDAPVGDGRAAGRQLADRQPKECIGAP